MSVIGIHGSVDPKVWDNGGGDNLWSNATNWSGNAKPVAGDDVVFDGTSIGHCQIDEAVTIATLTATAAYTGAGVDDGHIENTANSLVAITGNVSLANKKITFGTGAWTLSGSDIDFEDCASLGYVDRPSTGRLVFDCAGAVTLKPAKLAGDNPTPGDMPRITIGVGTILSLGGSHLGVHSYYSNVIDGTLNLSATAHWGLVYGLVEVGPNGKIIGDGRFTIGPNSAGTPRGISISDGAEIAVGKLFVTNLQMFTHFTPYLYNVGLFKHTNAGPIDHQAIEWEAGTYIFTGDVEFENRNAEQSITIKCDTNNPDIQIGRDLIWDKQAGDIIWIKGNETITFNGSGPQKADFGGASVGKLVVDKPGGVLTLASNVIADRFMGINGVLELNGYSIRTSGLGTFAARFAIVRPGHIITQRQVRRSLIITNGD